MELTSWQTEILNTGLLCFSDLPRGVKKRFFLFHAQRGACFWCGQQMVIHFKDGGTQPAEMATLEHLDSRLSPFRGGHSHERRIVAAHAKCNHERAKQEQAALSISELHQRSGHLSVEGQK